MRAEAVDLAVVGKEQEIRMGRRVHHLTDQVFLLQPGALYPPPAPPLCTEGGGRDRLYVAALGHGDDYLFIIDEVFDSHFTGVVRNDAAPRVGELVTDRRHLGGDDAAQLRVVGQDRLQL